MSLIHWWQLNGDLRDKGVNTFTISSTPSFNDNGKIGKCAINSSMGAGQTYLTSETLPLNNNSPISIFCWVYMSSYTSTGANLNGLVSNHNHSHNGDTGSGFGLNLRNNGNSFNVSISTSSSSGRTYSSYHGNTTFYTGSWHHVGFTYNGSRVNFYLDGNYDGGFDFTSSYNSNNPIGIFCWSTGYTHYSSDCRLNDVRIYNHALSLKEVKEISKALILHYTFEDLGRYNLLQGNYVATATSSGVNTSGNGNITLPSGFSYNNFIGKTIVLTYDYSVEGDRANNTGNWQYDRFGIHGTISYNSGSTAYPFTDYLEARGTGKAVMYYTVPSSWSSIQGLSLAFQPFNKPASGNSNTWYIKNVKLEILPSSSDKYTEFIDTNESTAFDNSGFSNNGSFSGKIEISSDTAIGSKSVILNNVWCVGKGPSYTPKLTVLMWIKQSVPDRQIFLFGTFNSWTNNGIGWWIDQGGTGASNLVRIAEASAHTGATFIENICDGNWHLIGITWDGSTYKTYKDGSLIGSVIPSSTGGINNPVWVFGGAYFNNEKMQGKLSDVKVYVTALSESDILSEYKCKLSIDNKGNMYTNKFIENNYFKITKPKIVYSKVFAEYMTLSDGSLWIPICVHYVPDGLFDGSSNKYYFKQSNIWNAFGLINDMPRPENSYYEFYVTQQASVEGSFSWYRFKQTVNPLNASWSDVNPSNVGSKVIRISSSQTNNYAGMYFYNNTNVAMCFANNSNGNWFGCGIRAYWNSGIPGYNEQAVKGWQLVYMRVSSAITKLYKENLLIANQIKEI